MSDRLKEIRERLESAQAQTWVDYDWYAQDIPYLLAELERATKAEEVLSAQNSQLIDEVGRLRAELERVTAERDEWKWEYDNLKKFANQFEEERDQLKADLEEVTEDRDELCGIATRTDMRAKLEYQVKQEREIAELKAEVARLHEKYDHQLLVKREERLSAALEFVKSELREAVKEVIPIYENDAKLILAEIERLEGGMNG